MKLVLFDICCKNIASRNFFGVTEQLCSFMEGSTKRHGFFIDVQKELVENDLRRTQILKALSVTRWAEWIDKCRVILIAMDFGVEKLDRIQTSDAFDRDTSGTVKALRKAIDFEFCLHLVTLNRVITVTSIISKYPQGADMDISTALQILDNCKTELSRQNI